MYLFFKKNSKDNEKLEKLEKSKEILLQLYAICNKTTDVVKIQQAETFFRDLKKKKVRLYKVIFLY